MSWRFLRERRAELALRRSSLPQKQAPRGIGAKYAERRLILLLARINRMPFLGDYHGSGFMTEDSVMKLCWWVVSVPLAGLVKNLDA